MWEIPTPKPANPILSRLAGGWEMSGILLFQSGFWFTPLFTGFDPSIPMPPPGRATPRLGAARIAALPGGEVPLGDGKDE